MATLTTRRLAFFEWPVVVTSAQRRSLVAGIDSQRELVCLPRIVEAPRLLQGPAEIVVGRRDSRSGIWAGDRLAV